MNDIINKLLIRSLSAKMLPKTRLWLIKKAHDSKGGCKKMKYLKSSDAKASKCHLKFSSLMMIFLSNL